MWPLSRRYVQASVVAQARPTEEVDVNEPSRPSTRKQGTTYVDRGGGNAVYGLGLIGALVFFWQQADSFGQYVIAVLKALVWPAFLVYEAFQAFIG